jgi:bacterioferritin-associated ferredoxin
MYWETAAKPCALFKDGKKPMIVCQCNGVSDRTIRKAVRDGAGTRSDVVRACTAGETCGGCAPAIDEIIEAERERIARSGLTVLELVTS